MKSSSAKNSKRSQRFEQRYVSVAELAVRWSVSPSSIYGQCGSHALRPIRFGEAVRGVVRRNRMSVEALLKMEGRRFPSSQITEPP